MEFVLKTNLMSTAVKYGILVALLFLMLEGLCVAIYKINPGNMLGWQFYEGAFVDARLPAVPYGWTSPEGLPRPGNAEATEVCAVAFGDSFTFADEVETDQAWPNVASTLLNCKVANYGVGGFGTDQAFLLYRAVNPTAPVTIIGIYPEMIRRNLAASWIFYGGEKGKTLKPLFQLKDNRLIQAPMPAEAATAVVREYHANDRYFKPYDFRFSYALSFVRFIYAKLYDERIHRSVNVLTDAEAMALQSNLLEEFRGEIRKNGSKVAIVFFPPVSAVQVGDFSYQAYLKQYQSMHSEDCVVDTGPALYSAIRNDGVNINAGSGHYSKQGNVIVAGVIAQRLRACGYL